jgi:uncharacterized protein YbaP (TraB family)
MKHAKKIIASFLLPFLAVTALAQSKYPSILWEITKPGLAKTSYLFGTYHISSKGVFKLADSVFYALKKVDMVGTEVNNNTWQREDDDYYKMKNNYDMLNDTQDELTINEGTFRKTSSVAKLPVFIGLQPNSINYFLYRNNRGNEDFEEEAFLDRFIASAGYKLGKKIVGLENYLESATKVIEAGKESELEEKRSNKKLPDGLTYSMINDMIFDGYKNNSLDMLDSLERYNYTSDAYYKKFITDRNYNQADSMDYYIRSGYALFAAVGSAHLPGEEGVIEILRKKGYTVRPVKLAGHAKEEIENIKKTIYPLRLQQYNIEGGYSYVSPGELFPSVKNNLLKIYSYVDMANGGYFQFCRMYNNSFLFGLNDTAVVHAIDSLLFENVKGDIINKQRTTVQGYTAMDVTSLVKNKDKERYRFIVTPYEILMLKAGGKNDYVQLKQVDSFFTAFKIEPVKGWHEWNCSFFGRPDNKVRYSQIAGNTCNGVLRVTINDRSLKSDEDFLKLAAESFTASQDLQKDENTNLNLLTIKNNNTQTYQLNNNGSMKVRYSIRHPFLYIYYSAAYNNAVPLLDWADGFKETSPGANLVYVYKDSLKAVELKLPYPLNFNSRWQSMTEKKTDKPDPDKKLNRDAALEYKKEKIYHGNRNWDTYQFQNPADNSMVWAVTASIDSNFYYANARMFWQQFIPQKSQTVIRSSYESDFGISGFSSVTSFSGSNTDSNTLGKKTSFVINLQYDTAQQQMQKLSFVVADSLSPRATLYTYYLVNNKVYGFAALVNYPGSKPSAFYQNLLQSFKPFNNTTPSTVFVNKMDKLVSAYLKAGNLAQSDLAETLNFFHFGIKDLAAADAALKSLQVKTPSNNILRKKIVAAVSEMDDKDGNWPKLSGWLKKIYENKDELLTIRLQALESVLNESEGSDVPWVLDNLAKNEEFKSSTVRRLLLDYITDLKEKNLVRNVVKLDDFGLPMNLSTNNLRRVMNLADSGFYSKKEVDIAFKEILKALADNKISLALKAETDLFKYPENEKKKNTYNSFADNNFQYYTNMFQMFYSSLPADSFFRSSFKNILSGGTVKDKISLLQALVKQKKTPTQLVAPLLKSLENEKTYYMDIYKAFAYQNKLEELGSPFNNRADIAKTYFKGSSYSYSSNELDTVYHYKTIVNTYYPKDSVYFFFYKRKNDRNPQLAYAILPVNMQLVNTERKVVYQLTDEQLNGKESFETISARILRKSYVNSLLSGSSRVFYLRDKSEKSINSEE